MTHWSDILSHDRLHACSKAREWAATIATYEEAWDTCPRGDWLLWFATKADVPHRVVVRAACACARTALRHVPAGEERPRLAIEAAEAWAEEPTKERLATVRSARRAADAADAADAAAYAAAADAADAAAYAAYAAAADAADAAAAYAAYAAAYAAAADAADAARRASQLETARIVRSIIRRPELPQ